MYIALDLRFSTRSQGEEGAKDDFCLHDFSTETNDPATSGKLEQADWSVTLLKVHSTPRLRNPLREEQVTWM